MEKKCQICGKPATVHFTQIVNNEMKNIDLCDECMAKSGLLNNQGSPLAMLAALGEALFGEVKKNISSLSGLICSSCGCTPVMFKETGRLGCANCYKDLNLIVDRLVESSQKGNCHVGKRPPHMKVKEVIDSQVASVEDIGAPVSQKSKKKRGNNQLAELQSELEQAIADERYEDAAKIRDQIKKYKK